MLTWLAYIVFPSTLGPVYLGRCFDAAVEQNVTRNFNLPVEPPEKLLALGASINV
jgi:hypothetical protein